MGPDEDQEPDVRPWESRGFQRLDVEPHRGRLIFSLGAAAAVLGALSLCTGLTGLAGFGLGLAAWLMARRDLGRMETGLMDRRGEKRTRRGSDLGLLGVLLGLFGALLWTGLVLDKLLPPPYGGGGP